ncbi:hypothetical protein NSDW_01640 [Novosphingobium olei]|nr:hypothetical protein NSDW_01640 [Novosphingobium olei]
MTTCDSRRFVGGCRKRYLGVCFDSIEEKQKGEGSLSTTFPGKLNDGVDEQPAWQLLTRTDRRFGQPDPIGFRAEGTVDKL